MLLGSLEVANVSVNECGDWKDVVDVGYTLTATPNIPPTEEHDTW